MTFRPASARLSLTILVVAGWALAAAPVSMGQQGASAIPAASGPVQRTIPDVVRDSLPNGVQILFARVNDLPLTEINVIVDAGLSRETHANRGAAWALNQLLLDANRNRTAEMVRTYLAELGSTVIPYAHYDYAQLYGRTLARNFSATLGVMADATVGPSLREQALVALQRTAPARLRRLPSSGERATVAAVRSVCGEEHVLSRYVLPEVEDVERLSLDELKEFHAAWYQPRRTTVIVTGNLDYRFVRTAIIEGFGSWEAPAAGARLHTAIDAPDVIGDGRSLVRLLPDDATPNGLAYFRLGVRAPLRGEKDFIATILLNSILSDGPESRLRRMFWERHVISPSFTAAVAFSRDCSYFMISGSATPLLADSVLGFAEETVREIAAEGITPVELEAAKERLLRNEPLAFASNRALQSLLKESVVYGISLQRLFTFTERLREVTAGDVQRVASELFRPERWRIVTLGNAEKLAPVLQRAGKKVVTLQAEHEEMNTGEQMQGE